MDFPLFVYGTLRRGFPAHARYCARARVIGRARLRGALFEHDDGFPVLVLPPRQVLALGTSNAAEDARLAARESDPRPQPRSLATVSARDLKASARRIEGEVLSFSSASVPLRALDTYEGYTPRRRSLFVRVLLDVELVGRGPSRAWTYVGGALMRPESLRPLQAGLWLSARP